MIDLRLCAALRILAERRRDYPLHGDSLDAAARDMIAEAVPPGLRIPGPDGRDMAREAFETIYRDLCEGGRG